MKTLFLAALVLSVSVINACVYKPAVQQGNILQQDEINKIRPGMTKAQVSYVLGNPVLDTNLDNDTWYYLYYLLPSEGEKREERLILHFNGDLLESIEGTMKPEANQE